MQIDCTDAGYAFGLVLILNVNTTERYCSFEPGAGYKVLVHGPHTHPRIHDYSRIVPYEYETRMILTPFILKSESNVRQINVAYRKCLFQDENPLEMYR